MQVPVSPFATDKGNTPEAKSGHDPLMPQRPTQEADPRPQAPGLPPKPPQPAHSVPAAPQAVPDDQTASGLTLPHDLQVRIDICLLTSVSVALPPSVCTVTN